jgi:multiple sugar transport system substrate-binding protein
LYSQMNSIVIVIGLLMSIVTPTTLQPSLATANYTTGTPDPLLSDTTTTYLQSNQSTSTAVDKTDVTIRGIFNRVPDGLTIGNWDQLLQPALDELNRRHPDMNIKIEYTAPTGLQIRNTILDRLSNGDPIDIVVIDQQWLGEFAERGLLRNLTADFEQWGRISDLYEANLDGCVYNNTIYGLWLWTDIRGMWYWKDMLQEAGVDPESLKTWDGYISSAMKLNAALKDQGIQGVHLVGAPHSPDMWYPYLWMLGGDILERKDGHPTKGSYWYPSFNSTEGVQALQFLKDQVDAGIKPQKEHSFGREFANRTFAVMLEVSSMLGQFPRESWPTLEEKVGFIPMFPVPNQTTQTSTMMGGWELAIPSTSQNSRLSWELITIMAQPELLGPFLQQYGYLPTQRTLGEGPASEQLKESVPYFEEMVSMIPYGGIRPNIAEYPEIAEDIHQAIQQVYNGTKQPEEALDEAAAKSAKVLGW